MIEFVAMGSLLAAFVWIIQRRRWSWLLRLALSLVLTSVFGFVLFVALPPDTLGPTGHWYDATPWRELALFAIMLAGMAARYMTSVIEVRREKLAAFKKAGARGKKPTLEFDIWEFSYPLFVSVVTYGALLSQTGVDKLTVAGVVLSFQTGFFWQTVLVKRQEVA